MFKESLKLKNIATQLTLKHDRVGHVEIKKCLFLVNYGDMPKAFARCYSLLFHPIAFFTEKDFCIVVYDSNTDWMSDQQLAILLLHELMHIPMIGYKLIDHNIKEFRDILSIDLEWNKPGKKVVDILA